jgi:endoglucanase
MTDFDINTTSMFSHLVIIKTAFVSLIMISLALTMSCEEGVQEPAVTIEITPATPPNGFSEIRDISSFDLVGEMGVGWNLGNSFDVTSKDKTQWGNPLPRTKTIDTVNAMGFKTLRIPVTWQFHQSSTAPYEIDIEYLGQIKEIVDAGLTLGMHVIINVHHDENWVVPSADRAPETLARLSSLWTQVATYFGSYNEQLIFETLNEPRIKNIPEEWSGGTPEGRAFLNDFYKAAVDAIRAAGGNNAQRHIMVPTWAASTVQVAMDDLVIPNNDPKVIVSLHTYFPWGFAGEANQDWGTDADKQALEDEFDRIRQHWIVGQQRAVILGEWGTIDSNPLSSREEYAAFYAAQARERGLLTIVWDDGGMFRMLNRNRLRWDYRTIAEAIVKAYE